MPFPTDPQPEVPLQDPDPPEIQEPSGVTGSSGESSPHPPDQPRTSESQEIHTAAATTSSTTPSTTTTTAAATGNRNAGLTLERSYPSRGHTRPNCLHDERPKDWGNFD